jgi:DNA replicative helicase MCM subunit Mcm2 (Cdc46/Mcm family)
LKEDVQQKLFPGEDAPTKPAKKPDKPPEELILEYIVESGEASKEMLYAAAKTLKLTPEEVEEILERLRFEGLIYSPRYGTYKTV